MHGRETSVSIPGRDDPWYGRPHMLVQSYQREVPDTDARIARALLREKDFCVVVVRTRGLALDSGALRHGIKHLERLRRPQLTIVLQGRGYLDLGEHVIELREGDVACTDQRAHRGEGYGPDSEVILVGWSTGSTMAFGTGRIDRATVHRLRGHLGEFDRTEPRAWTAALAHELESSVGLDTLPRTPSAITPAPVQLGRLYHALGTAFSRLDTQPSLTEIAESIGVTERQAHRLIAELARKYDHPFLGWREMVQEMRLTWAAQLLSIPEMPLGRVARFAGYRSTNALHHACSLRGASTPTTIAKELAHRWR
jgi:AraC-like DNA-binding protein